jgi:hypothetical protein
MIYIFGDSHANFSLKNLPLPHVNLFENSITMFRIGRDNIIIKFNKSIDTVENVLVFVYGEVDCRCHIGKQIALGRTEDDIIQELVSKYFLTIKNNVNNAKVIISSIIPPTRQNECEAVNGPITHEFPFVGSDDDRVRFTEKMNIQLQEKCKENNFIFTDLFPFYRRPDGTLKYEFSDNTMHVKNNTHCLEEFLTTISSLDI